MSSLTRWQAVLSKNPLWTALNSYGRGLLKDGQEVEQVMHSLGYKGYKANAIKGYDPQGNPIADTDTPTVYVNRQGKQVSREEFWNNFDKENNL